MQARGPTDTSSGSGQDATQDIKKQARDLADQTKEQGKAMLDQQRSSAAGQVDSVAHAFRTAAEQLQNEGQGTGNYVGMVADQLESAARQLREKNLDELMHGVQDMARRSPATFIAGSVAVGFLLSRFLKSSGQHGYSSDSRRAYGGEDEYGDLGYDRGYSSGQDYASSGQSSRPVAEAYGYGTGGVGISQPSDPYGDMSGQSMAGRNDTTISTGSTQTTIANTPDTKPGTDNLGGSNYGNR